MAKNILICDDAAFMRMMIKDILTKNGYTVAGRCSKCPIFPRTLSERSVSIIVVIMIELPSFGVVAF